MKNVLAKLTVPLVCSALIFSGCGTAGTKNYAGSQSNNANIKSGSTNNGGTTSTNRTSGTSGTGTYGTTSTTGTSGNYGTTSTTGTTTGNNANLYGGSGISTAIENQLKASGFYGAHVLVLDDTVILGQTSTGTTGTSGYTGGSSTTSPAQSQIQTLYGGVRVLTVTNPEAIRAIDRVKSSMKTNNITNTKISSDLDFILRNAR